MPERASNLKIKTGWIPVKSISVVWVQAQRVFKFEWAEHLANTMDPDKFGFVVVSKADADGVYHCVDGQHRRKAVEMLWGPDEKVPCQIVEADTPERAAQIFDGIQTRRKLQPLEAFRVRVTAGQKDECMVDNIARRCGYVVTPHVHNSIVCVAALLSVLRSHGAKTLEQTLQMLQASWGNDPHAAGALMVRGYAAFLAEHAEHINWERLKACVASETPGRLIGVAKTGREIHGGSQAEAIKFILETRYNKGLSAGRQLRSMAKDDAIVANATTKKTDARVSH